MLSSSTPASSWILSARSTQDSEKKTCQHVRTKSDDGENDSSRARVSRLGYLPTIDELLPGMRPLAGLGVRALYASSRRKNRYRSAADRGSSRADGVHASRRRDRPRQHVLCEDHLKKKPEHLAVLRRLLRDIDQTHDDVAGSMSPSSPSGARS